MEVRRKKHKNTVWLRRKGGFRKTGSILTSLNLRGQIKVIYFICKDVNSVLQEFNVKRHYETDRKSYDTFTSFPVRPSIICWLLKLALSHQNLEKPCHSLCLCLKMVFEVRSKRPPSSFFSRCAVGFPTAEHCISETPWQKTK